ncbi:hypothetical protein [Burkholderia cepacia]|uniref:hypothetical protein n=1 Tax=Burkholderia cepacia TaxID=292 RepID=UPI002AB66E02|nr:hypothetical protein [Burkholderia cepacia]
MAGATVWAVMKQWTPGDLLMLRVSEKRARGIPSVICTDLVSGAALLKQFLHGSKVLRGAAVVSTRRARQVDDWNLDPLREIRVGATEFSEDDCTLLTVAQFTTVTGREFSVPSGFATRYTRGRRVWRAIGLGAITESRYAAKWANHEIGPAFYSEVERVGKIVD